MTRRCASGESSRPGRRADTSGRINPALSFGKKLTIAVAWACPPQSTGARVMVQVRDASSAVAHDMGTLSAGPPGMHSTAWTTNASGTYRIEAQVTCTHHDPRVPGTVVDGADAGAT